MENTEDPAPRPVPALTSDPKTPKRGDSYGAIAGLGTVAGIGILLGVILSFVANGIGSNDLQFSTTDLATRISVASFAGVSFTVGAICAAAAATLAGLREMLRRYRAGEPL